MRDCKEIKILLVISPSSHRVEGLPTLSRGLPETETELHELSDEFVFAVLVSSRLGFSSLTLCWVSVLLSFHSVRFC